MDNRVNISVRGKMKAVPSLTIDDCTVVILGRWLKVARIHGESWYDGTAAADVVSFVATLKEKRLKADVLTVAQRLPDTQRKYNYRTEWDNVAAIRTDNFKDWWENRLPQETRKNVRRADKRGVVVRRVQFDDSLIHGLKGIYDETPTRQGARFWHYGKDFDTVKSDNANYLDRSELIGAYHQGELIGFLKMVYVGRTANTMQIVAKSAHSDKRPMNALVAKAVEVCEQKGMSYFIYGQYVYGRKTAGQLTEFKRRNGFEQFFLPRYYIPLTLKGHLMLALGLHRDLRAILPRWLHTALRSVRSKWYGAREQCVRLFGIPGHHGQPSRSKVNPEWADGEHRFRSS